MKQIIYVSTDGDEWKAALREEVKVASKPDDMPGYHHVGEGRLHK